MRPRRDQEETKERPRRTLKGSIVGVLYSCAIAVVVAVAVAVAVAVVFGCETTFFSLSF